jgi:hypothetical protein
MYWRKIARIYRPVKEGTFSQYELKEGGVWVDLSKASSR